ncbi:unnamed protein product [Schistocephalus solidus]|uniref:GIY-YIG domain-containing protein n=1 Tax=Schistocephalus solidus TaxID=70667 RepID=A0A183SYC8_SCHSO|nr:unnamed protein product [Schistocephalus solidus]
MGSLDSGQVAKLFIQQLEKIPFIRQEPNFGVVTMTTFVIVRKNMPNFPIILNSISLDIKSTCEEVREQHLLFFDVCLSTYVGHTRQQLRTRINEHKLAIRRRDPLSLVFAHAVDCDHHFNWDATEVVAMANTKQAREFLEAWHSNTNSINHHVDLDAHYEGLRARLTDSRQP